MRFATKVAIAVCDELAVWQKINIACFLSGGLVGSYPELAGECYVDASSRSYGKLIRQPVLVFIGSRAALTRSLQRALERDLTPSIYTQSLFSTANDADNRHAVAVVPTEGLDLVGFGLHAARKDVDRVMEGLALHP
jgi:hypothetical protein